MYITGDAVALLAGQRTCDSQSHRSRVWVMAGYYCVLALPLICHQTV